MNRPCSTGSETCSFSGSKEPHMVHEQHQLVEEGAAQKHVVRHQMETEQRAYLRIRNQSHRNVTLFLRKYNILATTITGPKHYHRSEQAALLTSAEVQSWTRQLKEARGPSENFQNLNERNLAESHRHIADRDRALIEGRALW